MNKIKILLLCLIMIFSSAAFTGCNNLEPPEKGSCVVVLDNVSLEILYRLGVDVVGIPSSGWENISEEFTDKEKYADVGIPMSPNYMEIAMLNPSEVIMSDATEIAFGNIKSSFDALGIKVKFFSYNSIPDLKISITAIGSYFDKQDKAQEILDELEQKEREVLDKAEERDAIPRVMTLFAAPLGTASQSISIATSGLYAGSLVSYAGAINVMDEIYPNKTPAMLKPDNWSPILDLEPEYIFCTAHGGADEVWSLYDSAFDSSPWNLFPAVRNKQIYYLPEEMIGVIASLKFTQAIAYIWDIFDGKVEPLRGGYSA